MLHIGAGDIELDGGDGAEFVDAGGALSVVFHGGAADIDDEVGVDILDLGIDVLAEVIDALVLQSDAVEHTAGGLVHAWVVIALAVVEGGALDDDGAYLVEWYEVLKLYAVADAPTLRRKFRQSSSRR